MAAIHGLYKLTQKQEKQIKQLQTKVAQLKHRRR